MEAKKIKKTKIFWDLDTGVIKTCPIDEDEYADTPCNILYSGVEEVYGNWIFFSEDEPNPLTLETCLDNFETYEGALAQINEIIENADTPWSNVGESDVIALSEQLDVWGIGEDSEFVPVYDALYELVSEKMSSEEHSADALKEFREKCKNYCKIFNGCGDTCDCDISTAKDLLNAIDEKDEEKFKETILRYYGLLGNAGKGFIPYLKGREDEYANIIKKSTWIIL